MVLPPPAPGHRGSRDPGGSLGSSLATGKLEDLPPLVPWKVTALWLFPEALVCWFWELVLD